jgi:hypothetical protein
LPAFPQSVRKHLKTGFRELVPEGIDRTQAGSRYERPRFMNASIPLMIDKQFIFEK